MRFDRTDRGKLHMQTFSALLHYDYNIPCLAGYEDLTFAYKPGNRWLSGHQMTIRGKSSGLTDVDLIQAGRTMGLSGQKCRTILEKIVEVTGGWMAYAERSGVNEEQALAIRQNMGNRESSGA